MSNELHSPDVAYILQNVLGCKWTLHLLAEVRRGVNRPGQLVRSADGLTTKVLNERLVKLVRFGLLEKTSFPEVPPRVEYELTAFGRRFTSLLDEIDRLQAEL
ncbi:putative HTH-type transcriptional regulator YtcD [Novipirellula galeiformis]|uniref:Putative HTH-type transcriptional regulator YtcD n=1 Tax=Novipirellula galeiformis TaxID=2528004 RepID=A0A5C6CP83_9BACT|nr:helix-turn-helix domain-containing protein [Novipirellula galeiformis]TWU25201.1 putative HTH-type transcriptional regulator YtcD [Novipirellula galeiformis]